MMAGQIKRLPNIQSDPRNIFHRKLTVTAADLLSAPPAGPFPAAPQSRVGSQACSNRCVGQLALDALSVFLRLVQQKSR
jgi:hypothetical protein